MKMKLEYIYCTNCYYFKMYDEDTPYCMYKDRCDIIDCEDSKDRKYRPFYRRDKIISSKEALKDVIPIEWSEDVLSGEKKVVIAKTNVMDTSL